MFIYIFLNDKMYKTTGLWIFFRATYELRYPQKNHPYKIYVELVDLSEGISIKLKFNRSNFI